MMMKGKIISVYLIVGVILMGYSFLFSPYTIDLASAAPDDGINGYQELHEDWKVTGYEEYTDEIIALFGDLTIENGGHLVLNSCTLMMMSITLAPYEITVKNGGTLELYDCYITDPPDDDDTEFLSAYYYFIAKSGSTLIIEDSTVRQSGFIDISNPEHMGLFVGTNSGHISNSIINTSIVALTFSGNNTGFFIENINISQIFMNPLSIANSKGLGINNVNFSEVGENALIVAQSSSAFSIENITLTEDEVIYLQSSNNFTLKNIAGSMANRPLRVEDCGDFTLQNLLFTPSLEWNRKLEIQRSHDFIIDGIQTADDHDVISISDSSFGSITDITSSNLTRLIEIFESDNIDISKINIVQGQDIIRTWNCNQITMDNIVLADVWSPIYFNSTDNLLLSNLSITGLTGTGIVATYGSTWVNVSKAYLESDSMEHTTGFRIESSSVSIWNYSTYNINLSIDCWQGDINGENILINGIYEPYSGIEIKEAEYVFLSNVTVLNPRFYGIIFMDCQGGTVRVHNVYINDSSYGIDFVRSDAILSDISLYNVVEDIQAFDNSHLTVMNSTINRYRLANSELICINAVNASSSLMSGSSSLICKWWVDVYVEDNIGPVAGAKIDIYDNPGPMEIQSVTGPDGYARNIPVTEVVWTPGPVADYITPHSARAWETGWEAFNGFFIVSGNMQIDITYSGNAPPNMPTNLISYSDENSNIILTWEPSTSWDVVGYNIYIARDTTSLGNYLSVGIPNATVSETFYAHVSGSEDWIFYLYAVKADDGENESSRYSKTQCGDWVVNKTTPQYVSGENITLSGSLRIYGDLELGNSTLIIDIYSEQDFGIFVNNSAHFIVENVTFAGVDGDPYFFYIDQDAQVSINGSRIIYPGDDVQVTEEYLKGIVSFTRNLTITNSEIEVRYWGLGIFGVYDFLGTIYNITMNSHSWETAEYLLKIIDSSNIDINRMTANARADYGIYAKSVSSLDISFCNITLEGFGEEPYYGIFLHQCNQGRIHNNTLILGNPGIFILNSDNINVEKSNISAREQSGIHVQSSRYTTMQKCAFVRTNGNVDDAIYLSWCMYSTVKNIVGVDNQRLIRMENESHSSIENITHTGGELGIWLINSNNLLLKNIYLTFLQTGIRITGCRDITLLNVKINLTINCLFMDSPGPVTLINCTISNGINGEVIAKGYKGEVGTLIIDNSTIKAFGDVSLVLNDSAVVYLINSSVNLSKLSIRDSGSRVELYHYLSLKVYDIDNNIPSWANITIMNAKDNIVYTKMVFMGFGQWILIHEKTIFKGANYTDNPHRIFFNDGSHYGEMEVYINFSQHLDVQVSNVPPILLWVNINPMNPKTDTDLVLNYMYQDPEDDPESGSIIHWYVNGVHNAIYDGLTTINSQFTSKYHTWQAVVYPSDGYDSTYPFYPFESNVLYIDNTEPIVSNITISPFEPNSGDDIFVEYDVFDIDGDGLDSSKTSHRWYYLNESSVWIYSGIDSFYLSDQYTSRGQIWRCEVTPNDGDDYGVTVKSQNISIGNTPPSITNPRIITQGGKVILTGKDNLKVVYNYTDADGDAEYGTSYEWYLQRGGGVWVKYNVNSSILPSNYTQREDLWRCRIIPMDGYDTGFEAWTDVHEIFNTPPIVSNVSIIPQSPTSSDMLKVTYDFYDYDGDKDNGTSFRWVYEDAFGVGWDSGISGNVTQAERTFKGQTWFCYVTPSDGINVGAEAFSAGVLIRNTHPEIDDAEVEYIKDEEERYLSLHHTPWDIDGDTILSVEIQWYENGQVVPQLYNNQTVAGDFLEKDRKWYAQIRAFDGEDWGIWFVTSEIAIPNTPPYIAGVVFLSPPQRALSNQSLQPMFENLYKDDDGDPLVSYEIKWYKNNGHMEDYDDLNEISWEITRKGEIWYYKVRVSDGEDFSEWYSSTTTVIENSPPSDITKNPQQSEITITETETKEFNVSANDIDGDPLSYRWMLDGRIVLLDEDVESSIYLFKTNYDSDGEYILRLVITDGDDSSEITWTVSVLKMNRLPQITVIEPEGRSAKIKENEDLKFAITKSDADGDNLEVLWYIDGVLVWEGSDKYTYSPDYASSGSHTITVEVRETESNANTTYSWDVEVADVGEVTDTFLGLNWDLWSIILEILVIGGTGLLAFIGYRRIRKKKGALKTYMAEIEEVSAQREENPREYEEKLNDLEARISDEFSQGKIEDLHFLMLQEIIASERGGIRKAAITSKFGGLPEGILKELDEMLKDGKISREEYDGFVGTISKTKSLSEEDKKELSKMIGEWEVEDKDLVGEDSSNEKVIPKKSESEGNVKESPESTDGED